MCAVRGIEETAFVYLQVVFAGSVKVSFVTFKTKVAPLKVLTIPQLEQNIDASDSEALLALVRVKEQPWKPLVEKNG